MKTFHFKLLLLALISVLLWQNANAARFFTDQFAYADGANLGSTTGGGGATWTGDYSQIMVTGASTQTAPGGYPTAAGLGVAVTPTGSRKQTGVAFNGATGVPVGDGNVVYASFLLNVRTLPTEAQGNQRVAYMHSVAASQAAIEVVVSSAGQVGIQKKGSGTTFVSGTPVSSPGTHLVVMRYAFQDGNDEVAVWVDPDSDSYGVDSAPTIGAFASTTGGGSDMSAAITYFFIEAPAVTGPVYWMDEVRVGTTWAEVTSSGEVASPKPVVTQLLLAPQGLIVRGSNGSPGGVYQVIASTNLNLASSNWPALSSHTFDAVGNFGVTNPVSPGLPPQFIRLVFGGTNSTVPTAPVITSQPQGLTVAVGATSNMLVGATGTAPLAYFWLFNTNTAVGGNSNTLVLVNVQTNQAGSYQVIVSNGVGTATSSVAVLTVLVPPAITAHPTNLTVVAGGSAAFNVSATGTAPLRYQWYFNTNTPIANATNATLALNPVNATNAGSYSVTVTNAVGIATSSVATLTVLGPPVITAQPQSQSVAVSNDATFTVTASGTAPLTYKWYFNTNTAVGGNSNTLVLLNVQSNHAGTYSVIVTNTYGAVTSAFATLTVSTGIVNYAKFNLVGFGQGTTGGGVIPETDPAYRKVYTPLQFAQAIYDVNKVNGVKVIEIMNDLDLGWKEIGAEAQAVGTLTDGSSVVKMHPKLLTTGVSGCYINPRTNDANYVGLTIFSANGSAIRHCGLNVKATANIIIRNLKFDEYWEWDEQGKGQYDKNNWDFIVLSSGGGTVDHVWIDHCTFTVAYDGLADNKGGVSSVTYSWCKYAGDDGASNTNSFVRQQINSLESNKTAYAMYDFLRTHGFSIEDIVQVLQGSKKGTAVGETSLNPVNVNASLTFHHNWFNNMWDRHPRLAGGQVHMYNSYIYCTDVLAARRMRDARVAAMSPADQYTMENTYSFKPSINGSISTEDGAMLVEKSVYIDNNYPLRNNQTDPSNPIYTGKIKALDTIYQYDSTYVRGNSTDPGNPLGPFQDLNIKPFSWNTNAATPNGQLPYTYTMDDPSQLAAIVTNLTSGAGAGVLTWPKTNWLKTTY